MKSSASQAITKRLIIPVTRLMRNVTFTNKKQNKLLAKCFYQVDERIQCEKTIINYAHARRHSTSELDKTSDMWGLNQYNRRKKYTESDLFFHSTSIRRDISIILGP